MADGVTIKLAGDRDVIAALAELRDFMPRSWLRGALRKAAQMIESDIKASAPVGIAVLGDKHPGRLRDNIAIRTRTTRDSISARVVINTKGKADSDQNAFYWRFVEFGHAGRDGKFVPAYPFITPAVEANQRAASQAVFDVIDNSLKRAERKAKRAGL